MHVGEDSGVKVGVSASVGGNDNEEDDDGAPGGNVGVMPDGSLSTPDFSSRTVISLEFSFVPTFHSSVGLLLIEVSFGRFGM